MIDVFFVFCTFFEISISGDIVGPRTCIIEIPWNDPLNGMETEMLALWSGRCFHLAESEPILAVVKDFIKHKCNSILKNKFHPNYILSAPL